MESRPKRGTSIRPEKSRNLLDPEASAGQQQRRGADRAVPLSPIIVYFFTKICAAKISRKKGVIDVKRKIKKNRIRFARTRAIDLIFLS